MSIVRDVPPAAVRDLLERPPRAAVGFIRTGEAEIVPVHARCEADAYAFDAVVPLDGQEVVLVIDDGPYWFQLRGISVRGTARQVAPGRYVLGPRRVVAWDYGTIHEEP